MEKSKNLNNCILHKKIKKLICNKKIYKFNKKIKLLNV